MKNLTEKETNLERHKRSLVFVKIRQLILLTKCIQHLLHTRHCLGHLAGKVIYSLSEHIHLLITNVNLV